MAQPVEQRLHRPHRIAAAVFSQQRQRHRRVVGRPRRLHGRRRRAAAVGDGLKGEAPAGAAGGVYLLVPLHGGDVVLLLQIGHQLRARLPLHLGHLLPVEAALKADADAVVVVVPRVCAHGVLRSAPIDAPVLPDEKVVSDARPAVGQMPLVYLLGRTRHRRRVVQDDAPRGTAPRQRHSPVIRLLKNLHAAHPPLSSPPHFSAVPAAWTETPAQARPWPPRSPEWRSAR